MDITVQSYTGLTVIIAQGILSDSTFAEIEEKFSQVPQTDSKQVWLECTHLQRIQLTQTCFCSYINKLLKLHKQGVRVVLFGVSGSTQRMLKLLQLNQLFQQAATLEDAYLLLNRQQPAGVPAAVTQ